MKFCAESVGAPSIAQSIPMSPKGIYPGRAASQDKLGLISIAQKSVASHALRTKFHGEGVGHIKSVYVLSFAMRAVQRGIVEAYEAVGGCLLGE